MKELQLKQLTDLMVTAACGLTSLLELLVERGADITIRDKDGKLALDWLLAGMQHGHRSHYQDVLSNYSQRRLNSLFCLLRKASANAILHKLAEMAIPDETQDLDAKPTTEQTETPT
jgi:hypothetical protein